MYDIQKTSFSRTVLSDKWLTQAIHNDTAPNIHWKPVLHIKMLVAM